MAEFCIRRSTSDDVEELIARLRPDDRAELEISTTMPVPQAIRASVAATLAPYTVTIDGQVACIFGVMVLSLLYPAAPWMLATETFGREPLRTARISARLLRSMLRLHGHLQNYVDVRNTLAIQWLKWLGFEMSEPLPFGPYGRLFHRFEKRLN